ncbi:MAG: hypothetical protein AAFR61_18255 [Bacteroidota bacterium]
MQNLTRLSLLTLCLLGLLSSLSAQKVKVKNGLLTVDGKETARIKATTNKELLGLVKDYKINNMAGDLLFEAVYSDLFPEDPNDNTIYYFEFSFPERDPAYFKLGKLGTIRSLGNLIGKNGLIKDGALDMAAVDALIRKKGKTPPVTADYSMASRNRSWPVEMREKGKIEQNGVLIASYRQQGDAYHFFLPQGTLAATVRFSGGNNATNFLVETFKDKQKRNVQRPAEGTIKAAAAIDPNYFALKRIVPWLVENNYL